MKITEVLQIASAIIISIGGTSAIIAGISKFLANKIAERLSAKYQLKLDEELEKYKSRLNRKNYVSQVRFDKEFSVYTDMSEKAISAVFSTAKIIDLLNSDKSPSSFETQKKDIVDKYNVANKALQQYASFMDEGIYDLYKDMFCKFRMLFNFYTYWECTVNNNGRDDSILIIIETPYVEGILHSEDITQDSYTLEQVEKIIVQTHSDITNISDEITKAVRTYLYNLDVI